MSYIPLEQEIKEPIRTTLTAFKSLGDSIYERVKNSSDWKTEHIDDLCAIRIKMFELEILLRREIEWLNG